MTPAPSSRSVMERSCVTSTGNRARFLCVRENVMGLKHKMHAEEFAAFKRFFGEAGFTLFEGKLDAHHFGVPQKRERVFIVGFNTQKYGTTVDFKFPLGNGTRRTVGDVLRGLDPRLCSSTKSWR